MDTKHELQLKWIVSDEHYTVPPEYNVLFFCLSADIGYQFLVFGNN